MRNNSFSHTLASVYFIKYFVSKKHNKVIYITTAKKKMDSKCTICNVS